MFKRLLIANRGEIACRIIKTARRLGIKSIVPYSEADEDAKHVRLADEAYFLGPAQPAQSYLNIPAILNLAKHYHIEAIHPGYGFLAENAAFASAVREAGFVFVGPPPDVIALMGDKLKAKKAAQEAGVTTLPGTDEALKDLDTALLAAREIGYPVLLKAAAGGGGKGMRVCRSEEELRDSMSSTIREAEKSFKDGRIFLEKYIERSRHIEVQVLGDSFGSLFILGERDCSLQRRHQKILEEAPAVHLSDKTRQALYEDARHLASHVGYTSAGTIEFIMDAQENFYFLEMNTRLQVEHPVTEMVWGIDLVEQMLRIAAGEKLNLQGLKSKGHAIEVRLCAEDPDLDFLPSVGRITRYSIPEEEKIFRLDSGVEAGDEVSVFYDSLLAKAISWGRTREEALETLQNKLNQIVIRGLTHNGSFLQRLLKWPEVLSGHLHTGLLSEKKRLKEAPLSEELKDAFLGVVLDCYARSDGKNQDSRELSVQWGESIIPLHFERLGEEVSLELEGRPLFVKRRRFESPLLWEGEVNGVFYIFQVEKRGLVWRVSGWGWDARLRIYQNHMVPYLPFMAKHALDQEHHFLLSPMPGKLIELDLEEGQKVKYGQRIAVIEAMKMENILRAPFEGTVLSIHVRQGETLSAHQRIAEIASS